MSADTSPRPLYILTETSSVLEYEVLYSFFFLNRIVNNFSWLIILYTKKMPVVELDLGAIERSLNPSDFRDEAVDHEYQWLNYLKIHF